MGDKVTSPNLGAADSEQQDRWRKPTHPHRKGSVPAWKYDSDKLDDRVEDGAGGQGQKDQAHRVAGYGRSTAFPSVVDGLMRCTKLGRRALSG